MTRSPLPLASEPAAATAEPAATTTEPRAPGLATIELPVSGMTCASCQARVQKTLGKQPGVSEATVNLLMENATVTYNPLVIGPDALIRAIRDTGYDAALPKPARSPLTAVTEDDAARDARYSALKIRALWSLVLGSVVMLASMPLAHGPSNGHAHGADPLTAWLAQWLDAPIRAAIPWLYAVDRSVLLGISLVLSVVILGWAGREFFTRGWTAVRHGGPDMNSLVALGTGAAFLYSLVATFWPTLFAEQGIAPAVYYEAAALIIALVLLGRMLEARATRQTASSLRALVALQPPQARVMRDGQEVELAVEAIHPGEVVFVRPGERIPTDGVISSGDTAADESMLTGESFPVAKKPGDFVIGGSVNRSSAFQYRATTLGSDSVLARIVRLMRDAQGTRAPTQALADRVSAVFVPAVVAAAVIAFVVWMIAADTARLTWATHAAVTVLIIACPCAMGLAVPTAVMVATGKGADLGALFKGAAALEHLDDVDTVVLDKTGTITQGTPTVTDVVPAAGFDETSLFTLAASLERGSEHPLASAFLTAATERGLTLTAPESATSVAGLGLTGVVDGRGAAIGNQQLMDDWSVDTAPLREAADGLAAAGKTVAYVSVDGTLAGAVAISDPLRPTARETIAAFRKRGLDVVLLTGDSERAAQAVAREAGIDRVIARVLPEGKVAEIRRLQAAGHRVAMIGDGINDAPALAQSDVGIAMGSGTGVAIAAADVTLMRPDLRAVVAAMDLSRKTRVTMRQNLFWAFVYNVIGIPIAAGVLYPAYGILLSPVIASAAMALSDVFVVGNSLRLGAYRPSIGAT